MSNVQFLIDSVDYTDFVQYDTVHADNNVIMTSDTMDLDVEIDPTKDSVTRPKCGQEIIWQNPNLIVTAPDGTQKPYREFAGVVSSVKETVDGVLLLYTVHCRSYIQWFDRHLVTYWYSEDSPENIIANVRGTQPDAIIPGFVNKNGAGGFTTYNVQTTNIQVIPQYFDHSKPSEAMKNICDQIEYGWYVDYYRDVHFYDAETFTSPLPNNVLDVDNDMQSYGDLEIEENGEQVYNSIFLKGFKTRSADYYVLPFIGDGSTTQWSLGYRVSSFKGDVQAQVYPSLAAYQADTSYQSGGNPSSGTTLAIARDLLDGAPGQAAASNTCYIHYTQHLARVPNFNGAGALPSGYVLAVRFHYLKDAIFQALDPHKQQTIRQIEGPSSDGVYEYVHQEKSLTNATMSAVMAKAQLLLMKYGIPQIQGRFNTYFNATTSTGWRAGQYFYLKSQYRFGGQFAAGKGDAANVMYVQRVNKTIVKNETGELVVLSTVEFANSPYLV